MSDHSKSSMNSKSSSYIIAMVNTFFHYVNKWGVDIFIIRHSVFQTFDSRILNEIPVYNIKTIFYEYRCIL